MMPIMFLEPDITMMGIDILYRYPDSFPLPTDWNIPVDNDTASPIQLGILGVGLIVTRVVHRYTARQENIILFMEARPEPNRFSAELAMYTDLSIFNSQIDIRIRETNTEIYSYAPLTHLNMLNDINDRHNEIMEYTAILNRLYLLAETDPDAIVPGPDGFNLNVYAAINDFLVKHNYNVCILIRLECAYMSIYTFHINPYEVKPLYAYEIQD